MKLIKWLMLALGLILLVMVGFWAAGIVYALLWYAFWIGLLGVVGYGGYKLLKKDEPRQLEEKTPIAVAELKNADRALKEYKDRYLPK